MATIATTAGHTIAREPPSDIDVVTEPCDWCGVDAPWHDNDEAGHTDDTSIMEEDQKKEDNPPPVQDDRYISSSPRIAIDPPATGDGRMKTLGPKMI